MRIGDKEESKGEKNIHVPRLNLLGGINLWTQQLANSRWLDVYDFKL